MSPMSVHPMGVNAANKWAVLGSSTRDEDGNGAHVMSVCSNGKDHQTSAPVKAVVLPVVGSSCGGQGGDVDLTPSRRYQAMNAASSLPEQWSRLKSKAKEFHDVVDLGQGCPDVDGCADAVEALAAALPCKQQTHHQYIPPSGTPEALKNIAAWYIRRYGEAFAALDPEKNICACSSASEGIYCFMQAFLDPGDEVVLHEPCYPFFVPTIVLTGAKPVSVRLQPPNWAIDEEALEKAITPKTRMLVLNSPHNPTGRVMTKSEREAVARVVRRHPRLLVLSDEMYEGIVFDGKRHRPFVEEPGMWERTVTIGGASKLMSLTGWRIGWAIGPHTLIGKISEVKYVVTYCPPAPLLHGVSAALKIFACLDREPLGITGGVENIFSSNRGALKEAFEWVGCTCYLPEGGYFMVCDVRDTGMEDAQFCEWLLREARVVAMPLSMFYLSANPGLEAEKDEPPPSTLIRVAICKCADAVEKAATRIKGLTPPAAAPAAAGEVKTK